MARHLPTEIVPYSGFYPQFSEDGEFLLLRDRRAVRVLRLPEGVAVASLEEAEELLPLAISAHGRYVLLRVEASTRDLRLWDWQRLGSYAIALSGPTPSAIITARFSPDEALCAVVGPHGVLHMFELGEDGPRLRVQVDPNLLALNNLDFSPDGSTLVVATGAGRLWFLDVGSLQESGEVEGYRCWFSEPHGAVAFSHDGRHLIIRDIDRQSVFVLRAPTLAEIDAAEKPRALTKLAMPAK
jgi:WD40 repeat protein